MSGSTADGRSRTYAIALAAIVLFAAALRLAGVFNDYPFTYYGDEMHLTKRAMAMGTGDLNPHWFHKPGLVMYLLLGSYGAFFAVGRVLGRFASTDAFGAYYLTDPGAFLVIGRLLVLAFGVATVVVTARLGRRVGGPLGGLLAAFTVGVLLPAAAGSQVIKEDVPAGFFVAAAALAYLAGGTGRRLAPVALAGALAGASMATKYYGIILIPGILLVEGLDVLSRRRSWGDLFVRSSVLVFAFVAAFFVCSPYNFLDPAWPRSLAERLHLFHGSAPTEPHFDPDGKVLYKPGLAAVPGASLHFFRQLVSREALTVPLFVLALLGILRLLPRGETRRDLIVLAAPCLVFWVAAVTVAPYHLQPRQLNAVLPLSCALVGPGAAGLAQLVRVRGRAHSAVAVALTVAACVPTFAATLENLRATTRMDSRNVAREWILQNVPGEEKMLLDDYGPILAPSPVAIARMEALLATLPKDEAFTSAQAKRLELLRHYPPPKTFDLVELGHEWWLPREVPDEELRRDWKSRDMGNPLVDRVPKDLAAYRAEGVIWVVTNSEAQGPYFATPSAAQAFPSFHRLYRELQRLRPARTFDPKDFGGKGPIVWIYDLRAA